MLQIIAWNTFGAKWDELWYFVGKVNPQNDILAITLEAGWAPWVKSQEVRTNATYPYTENKSYFDEISAMESNFCQYVEGKRGRTAWWIPWVKTLDSIKPNSRCSMGVLFAPATLASEVSVIEKGNSMIKDVNAARPIVSTRLSKGNNTFLTVLSVHLPSGKWSSDAAREALDAIAMNMGKIVPQGGAGLIVGDINVDLKKEEVEYGKKWKMLNVDRATQKGGGELDYGLLYDPAGQFKNSTAEELQKFGTGGNTSDHSVMLYSLY